jgi:protein-tyrosine phosphatase
MPDLFWVAAPAAGRLAVSTRPRGGLWLADDMELLRLASVDTLVSMLVPGELRELQLDDEAEHAEAAGLRFVNLPIPDLSTPTSMDIVPSLFALRDEVVSGRTVVAHCRQGVGRSPLVVASILVLLGVAAEDAWSRIKQVRGRHVPDTAAQGRWVEELALAKARAPEGPNARRPW